MKISISPALFSMFPDLTEYIVVAKGVGVETSKSREILEWSSAVQKEIRQSMSLAAFEASSNYKEWSDAYQKILEGSSVPRELWKDFSASHITLLRDILGGKELPNINPLVNFYNAFSIKYMAPFGGEDLSTYYGDIALDFAGAADIFIKINGNKIEELYENELVWKDDHSVSCRMWGWKQSERTKITKSTRDAIFFIDAISSLREDSNEDIWQATQLFAKQLEEYFGGEVEIYTLDKTSPSIEIDYKAKPLPEALKSIEARREDLKGLVREKTVGSKGIRKRKAEPVGLADPLSIKSRLEGWVKDQFAPDELPSDFFLQPSQDKRFGDYSSNVALRLAKEKKVNPKEIGAQLASKISAAAQFGKYFEKVEIFPNGFLNFWLSEEFMLAELKSAVGKENFGASNIGEGRKILIETPGWNPNKAAHVGHMLNLFLGKSLIRILSKVGFHVDNDDIANDKGLPVMEAIWQYMKSGNDSTPELEGLKPDHFVFKYYLAGKKAYNDDPKVQEEIKEVLRRWESGDKEILGVWEKIVGWAYEGQYATMARVWEEPGYVWRESEVYAGGKDVVMKYLGQGVIEQLPDGALVARIEEKYGLPDTIVVKSDGTGLYHTQDIYLTLKKLEKFSPWRIIWVVAEEQIVHFQRLFAILDALQIAPIENLYHYAYAFVVDKDGKKLSSRSGNDLTADEMIDTMRDAVVRLLEDRGLKESSERSIHEVAEIVGIGALKYCLLSHDPFKQIKFNLDEAISFNGKSGPYIMYAYTRAKSILRKVKEKHDVAKQTDRVGLSEFDKKLLIEILRYPEILVQAADGYEPSLLAEYLYSLAKNFSGYYESVPILKSENEALLQVRLDIIGLLAYVIDDGLKLLGIKTLENM